MWMMRGTSARGGCAVVWLCDGDGGGKMGVLGVRRDEHGELNVVTPGQFGVRNWRWSSWYRNLALEYLDYRDHQRDTRSHDGGRM